MRARFVPSGRVYQIAGGVIVMNHRIDTRGRIMALVKVLGTSCKFIFSKFIFDRIDDVCNILSNNLTIPGALFGAGIAANPRAEWSSIGSSFIGAFRPTNILADDLT